MKLWMTYWIATQFQHTLCFFDETAQIGRTPCISWSGTEAHPGSLWSIVYTAAFLKWTIIQSMTFCCILQLELENKKLFTLRSRFLVGTGFLTFTNLLQSLKLLSVIFSSSFTQRASRLSTLPLLIISDSQNLALSLESCPVNVFMKYY